ncbi:MAG TPA: DUF1573 domain-containing protein [Verrucomicrobiae bacterium]|nr:DUF1573 domain-containing protein [Verrucomicrobiae bacterium]
MKREFLTAVVFAVATVSLSWAQGTNGPAVAAKGLAVGTNNAAEATNAPAGGTPKIQFDNTVYDFGTTSQVDSVTGTFTFHNAGDGELKIQRAVPSCGCTVASVKPDVLKPGEKGQLVFTVRLGGARGHLEKHINVPSNDRQSPNVSLTIKANVVQVVEVSPTQIVVGDLRPGATTNLVVHVRRTDGKKLSITNTETSNKSVRARVEPGDNDQSATVIIEVTGEGVARRFAEQVKLFLDGASQPMSTISVLGRVLGDISVTPEALFWGITDPQHWPGSYPEAMITRQITIEATQPTKPLEVQNVTSSVKEVSVELLPVEKGKTYKLMAKLGEVPKESTRGTISFDTNIASQPKVVVPVTINVLRR